MSGFHQFESLAEIEHRRVTGKPKARPTTYKGIENALLMVACEEGRTFYASYADGEWESWQERWA